MSMIGTLLLTPTPLRAQGFADADTPTIQVSERESLGKYITDGHGRTLYFFPRDSRNASKCQGFCVNTFRPYTIDEDARPSGGAGVVGARMGTLTRDNGDIQITYAGHPLYYFAGDISAGSIAGNGIIAFGDTWSALAPGGSAAVATKSSADTDEQEGKATKQALIDGSENPFAGDKEAAAEGKEIYLSVGCYGCHGRSGGGGMGPDLIEKHWRYGDSDADLFKSISQGRPNGMPPWDAHLDENEIWKIITYLRSIAKY